MIISTSKIRSFWTKIRRVKVPLRCRQWHRGGGLRHGLLGLRGQKFNCWRNRVKSPSSHWWWLRYCREVKRSSMMRMRIGFCCRSLLKFRNKIKSRKSHCCYAKRNRSSRLNSSRSVHHPCFKCEKNKSGCQCRPTKRSPGERRWRWV